MCQSSACANPTGGTVAQGTASISSSGSKLTITTSGNALINWQSFNIAANETTTFVQPSASSVAWNRINDVNTSQILGTLNANGLVVLQNQAGFYIGGAASINTHGLVMATAPSATPDLSSGSAWQFNAPPPTAKIINYGQINIAGGGSAFLIASDIENKNDPVLGTGTISAPGGKIGLYAGQQVLVSASPDGRGLSAQVTLPQGSVDNEGRLIADAGSIIAQAKTVNQGGLIQANSVQNVNGVIELVASDSVNLKASSDIEAHGDNSASSASPGGSVTIQSGNTFSDTVSDNGKGINVSGSAQGGVGGQIAISASQMTAPPQSTLTAQGNGGYANGSLTLGADEILLNSDGSPASGKLVIGGSYLSALSAGFSQISLNAADSLEVSANNVTLNQSGNLAATVGGVIGTLSLTAGNILTLDTSSKIKVDGGRISLTAPSVSLNGLLQANSIQQANGAIEVNAGSSLTLGDHSDIEVNGDPNATQPSPGGFVVLKADTYNDTASSKINVSGEAGGQGGIVEIFGNNLTDASSIQSSIGNSFATLINSYDLTLSGNPTDSSSSNPNLNVSDLAAYSQISLHASDNIELSKEWFLNNPGVPARLSLYANNSIILDDASGINADYHWSVNLSAGKGFSSTTASPASGSDGIYLNGSAYIQTQDGDINLWAANEVLLDTGGSYNGIRTMNGGNISVYTKYGDVNTGANPLGFVYNSNYNPDVTDPDYDPQLYSIANNSGASLGGISTAAGGNVTINAGGNVISYLPTGSTSAQSGGTAFHDAGTGAFGAAPGNVTITAGGSVYGHYVLADGVGSITVLQNVGAAAGNPFALSLISGSWNVAAPNGDIYLQEVRNPNGVFNNVASLGSGGKHLFDYSPQAAVDLTAGGVYLTGQNIPRPSDDVQVIYPPILNITAGAGGVVLEGNVTLFPSPEQNLNITTTAGGNFIAQPIGQITPVELLMSDSSQQQWLNPNTFSHYDHGTIPNQNGIPAIDNTPVLIDISGDMGNLTAQLTLITSKRTDITVGGNMLNCGFSGQNLLSSDVTSISVAGQIINQTSYTFATVPQGIGILPANDLPRSVANTWDAIFALLVNPQVLATLTMPANVPLASWKSIATSALAFPVVTGAPYTAANPGFVYNPTTYALGFKGAISQNIYSLLTQPLTVLRFDANGLPVLDANRHFVTDTVTWVAPSIITSLFNGSQNSSSTPESGYHLGGPGQFNITADSISLGSSYGILSCGVKDTPGGFTRYDNLAPYTTAGATVNVTVTGNLDMFSSTIAALGVGGDVNLTSLGGNLNLGSGALGVFTANQVGYGVFTTGGGNVNVTAPGTVNVNGSRIATYNGGDIFVESYFNDVNVGSGGDVQNGALVNYVNPVTHQAAYYAEVVYGCGIIADTLVPGHNMPPNAATLPGNITIKTPRGDIIGSLGGITQESLNGNLASGPTIDLEAGTFPSGTFGQPGYTAGYAGNIDMGSTGGVIGGTINASANGSISLLAVSRQNSTIQAAQNFSGTVLSGGSASVSGGGTVSGTIIGVGGVTVSGANLAGVDAISQNANVGGMSQNTLGATASASSASQSAATQSGNESKQLANTDQSDDDKKKGFKPGLSRHIKRVTVLLPRASR